MLMLMFANDMAMIRVVGCFQVLAHEDVISGLPFYGQVDKQRKKGKTCHTAARWGRGRQSWMAPGECMSCSRILPIYVRSQHKL